MKRIGIKKQINIVIIAAIIMAACNNRDAKNADLPYYNTPDFTPHWLAKGSDSIAKMHSISAFKFINQNGENITLENLKNHITVANFFFANCGSICPKMTHNLKLIQDSFQNNASVLIVSFSVKPWQDSVLALKNYEKQNELNGKMWQLITGNKAEIYSLARRSFFAEQDAGYNRDSTEFLHTEHVVLVDKNLHIRGIYNGTDVEEIQKLKEDIRLLIKE